MQKQILKLDLTKQQVNKLNSLLPKTYKLIQKEELNNKDVKRSVYKVAKNKQFKRLGIKQDPIQSIDHLISQLDQFSTAFIEIFEQIKIFLKGFNFKDWSKQLINYSKTLTTLVKKTSIIKYNQYVQIIKQQIDIVLEMSAPLKKTQQLQKQFTVWKLKKAQSLRKKKSSIQSRRETKLNNQILQMKNVLLQTIKQEYLLIYQTLNEISQKILAISQVMLVQQRRQQQQSLKFYKILIPKTQMYPQQKQKYKYFIQPYIKKVEEIKQLNQICLQLTIYIEQLEKYFIHLQKLICQKYQNLQMLLIQEGVWINYVKQTQLNLCKIQISKVCSLLIDQLKQRNKYKKYKDKESISKSIIQFINLLVDSFKQMYQKLT